MIYIQATNVSIKHESVCTHLGYRIKKCLGIIPVKLPDHLGLVVVREDFHDKSGAFVSGECMANQLLPGWAFSADERSNERMYD